MIETVEIEEAIPLDVIGFTLLDEAHESWDQRGVHLRVAVELHEDFGSVLERGSITHDGCSADAEVLWGAEHANSRIVTLGFDPIPGLLRTRVIDDVDRLALGTDSFEHVEDVLADAVAGNDDGDHALTRGSA